MGTVDGRGDPHEGKRGEMSGNLRFGAGRRDSDCGGLSCGRIDVSGGLSADRLWYFVLEKEVKVHENCCLEST